MDGFLPIRHCHAGSGVRAELAWRAASVMAADGADSQVFSGREGLDMPRGARQKPLKNGIKRECGHVWSVKLPGKRPLCESGHLEVDHMVITASLKHCAARVFGAMKLQELNILHLLIPAASPTWNNRIESTYNMIRICYINFGLDKVESLNELNKNRPCDYFSFAPADLGGSTGSPPQTLSLPLLINGVKPDIVIPFGSLQTGRLGCPDLPQILPQIVQKVQNDDGMVQKSASFAEMERKKQPRNSAGRGKSRMFHGKKTHF